MNRRSFLRTAAFAAPSLAFSQGAQRPNVVLIVADDLGYGGIGIQGASDIPTPHIDSIARNGVRFTNGYVSCPVCSPTRAGLMTGRYQQRFGHEFNPGPPNQANDVFGLPLTETTVADRFKSLGYATGMVGKWHLGYKPEYHPMKRGFDEFFGFPGGAHGYLQQDRDGNDVMRGTTPVEKLTYLTDMFGDEATAFIERRRRSPFFLYLPFNAVHAPMHDIPKYADRFKNISDERRRTHVAMMSAMDDNIGRVLGKIRESGAENNTLVIFISDNGGPTQQTTSKNTPLRGFKGQVYEGGIRVPFTMQWKGRIPAGKVYDQPVIALDIHPTVIAAAGGNIPAAAKLDGVNLLPYVTGTNKQSPHESLYWRFGQQSAIRMGDWKLLRVPGSEPQLYNLKADISETTDLASKEPDRLKQLDAKFQEWNSQLMEPRWQRGGDGKAGKKKGKKKA